MKKKITFIFALIIAASSVFSQENLIINAHNRVTTSLDGDWKYIIDPYENGYYNYRYEPFDSFNQYIGWYDGLPEKCETITWKIEQDKPVLISEFGAGAKAGLHGDENTRWTEEYQKNLYIQTLKMIDGIDKVQGFSPWILVDFRSPRRVLPEIQDGWNRKGLISDDGIKKEAFFILQNFYETK